MPISLAPAVDAALALGHIKIIPLIRIDLPGKTVGYHTGGRLFNYSGLDYLPNRYLSYEGFSSGLGNNIEEIKITFSDIPTTDPNDAIGQIETYNYTNAPVTVSFLAGDIVTDEALGVLVTNFYEIDGVTFVQSATDEKGDRTITIDITLQTLARRLRDQTYIKRSMTDQQRHNDAADTAFEYVATSPSWVVQWGQR
jgi:hypothetical protein